ncbi:predicted protein, partial [Nematostella vectensis]
TKFDRDKVTKIIVDVFKNKLANMHYNAKDCQAMAKELASVIREKCVELHLPGYRLVCTCTITKRLKPAPAIESGCLWDEKRSSIDNDSFAEYVYKNMDIYAIGTVYGVHIQ